MRNWCSRRRASSWVDALAHRDQPVLGHQLGDGLLRVGGEADVAIGQDADELALVALRPALDHRNAGDGIMLHQRQRVGQRLVGEDRDRVGDHARFELLHEPDLGGLLVGLEVAVDHAEAAGLRHGDRHPGFRHGVHRRGDDRQVQRNGLGQLRADVDIRRHDIGGAGFEQHVVEGEAVANQAVEGKRHRQLRRRQGRLCSGLGGCARSRVDEAR